MHQNQFRSKHGHESNLYCSDFDESGADQAVRSSALERRQFRQNPNNIRSIRDHIFISAHFCMNFGDFFTNLKMVKNVPKFQFGHGST